MKKKEIKKLIRYKIIEKLSGVFLLFMLATIFIETNGVLVSEVKKSFLFSITIVSIQCLFGGLYLLLKE